MANDVSLDGADATPGAATSAAAAPAETMDYLSFLKRRWEPVDYVKLALLLAIGATLYYFYACIHLFEGYTIFDWTWGRFAPRYNSEHGKLVPLIFAYLVWYHRDDLYKAKKEGSNSGLIWIAAGLFLFLIGVRTLQGRFAVAAAPVLLYGMVLYLWGKESARALRFPIGFLVFMIPVSGPIDQATAHLQFLVVGIAKFVCGLIGIPLYQVGTTLSPVDRSFKGFEIAEGCSGIRSLTAIVMVTTIYVHLINTEMWKRLVVLSCSIGFAIIANAGRIISIFIVAKLFSADFAGGPYHEVSGYISYPIALGAMVLTTRLLDFRVSDVKKVAKKIEEKAKDQPTDTYDY
ncbi:MAG TPA: exosortase/archaeosortase family protein [Chthoniobacteraceae bacterium]|jgi:exosortase|nr:exosortase/archaeosortase family protein [Chthoniobacteraceae bacterium]